MDPNVKSRPISDTPAAITPPPTPDADGNVSDTAAVVEPSSEVFGPRKLVGLVAGRLVNFVMADGAVRPLLIVNPWDGSGPVDGVLFFAGAQDRARHVRPLSPGGSGHLPTFATLLLNVAHSHEPEVGKWHWPHTGKVTASSVDANHFQTVFESAFADAFGKASTILKAQILDLMNEKLVLNLEAVNAMIEANTVNPDMTVVDGQGNVTGPPIPAGLQELREASEASGKSVDLGSQPEGSQGEGKPGEGGDQPDTPAASQGGS